MRRLPSWAWLALAAFALSACSFEPPRSESSQSGVATSGGLPPLASPTEKDRPPSPEEIPPDVAQTPDAVPQVEQKSATGNPDSYVALGKRYEILQDAAGYRERGVASWYGKKFHGKRTSCGEPYNMFKMTAAHKTLPIPCYVRVTNLDNGRSVVVRINDRGPFLHDRLIDLSYAAATKLQMVGHGEAPVEVEVVDANGSPTAPAPAVVAAATPAPAPAAPSVAVKPATTSPVTATAADAAKPSTSPTLAPAPVQAAAATNPRYLQAGTFADALNAASLRARLHDLGVAMVELRSDLRDGHYIYRVLIGPFLDTAALETARGVLAGQQLSAIPVAN
jgi:rare lipoprotein A